MALSKKQKILSWILQILVTIILLQTLFFKFTGAEESRYIFTRLGVEPWGRFAAGAFELIAGILLLIPRTAVIGALVSFGVISGAIFSHLTRLGIALTEVGDHGELFVMAMLVFIASAVIIYLRRKEIFLSL